MSLNLRQGVISGLVALAVCALFAFGLHRVMSLSAIEIAVAIGASRLIEWK